MESIKVKLTDKDYKIRRAQSAVEYAVLIACLTGALEVELTNEDYKIRKAQSTVEYAVLIACLVAAFIAMQIYIKRSLQGRFKGAADEIGDQYSAIATRSSLTQTLTQSVNVIGTPRWVTDSETGKNYEITEVVRNESGTAVIPGGSYEETGNLDEEPLY